MKRRSSSKAIPKQNWDPVIDAWGENIILAPIAPPCIGFFESIDKGKLTTNAKLIIRTRQIRPQLRGARRDSEFDWTGEISLTLNRVPNGSAIRKEYGCGFGRFWPAVYTDDGVVNSDDSVSFDVIIELDLFNYLAKSLKDIWCRDRELYSAFLLNPIPDSKDARVFFTLNTKGTIKSDWRLPTGIHLQEFTLSQFLPDVERSEDRNKRASV